MKTGSMEDLIKSANRVAITLSNVKKGDNMSTTSEMVAVIKQILDDPKLRKRGLTQIEIWQRLSETPKLKEKMMNEKGKPRKGLLLGIVSRVKNGDIKGLVGFKDTDNQFRLIRSDDDINIRLDLIKWLVDASENLKNREKKSDQKQAKWLEKYEETIKNVKLLIQAGESLSGKEAIMK